MKCSFHLKMFAECDKLESSILGAMNEASAALEENATSVNALKQRALSHSRIGNFAQARIDITDALTLAREYSFFFVLYQT